ncbi:MAG: glycosyltransferase, partial [Nitrospirota bacterium]
MNRDKPLVSIVIPTYNQADYLREALNSLIVQTYSDWEAIVVNDGSTDCTIEVMEEYANKDLRVKAFSKPNGGITSALNFGLDKAEGDFFCWLSSDDLFYPKKLELQIKAFQTLDDNYALVYGSFDLLQEETKKIEVQPFQEELLPGTEFAEALKFDFIDGCTIMIRMNVMKEIGGFNPYYRHSQDTELWIRIASRGYRFFQLHEKMTIRRIHVAQASTGNMIYCRYDHAWMINYYLEHFHLRELYRYFDFFDKNDIERFLDHFIGRMLHTEATINHPLLMEKFWKWFVHGLSSVPTNIQHFILKGCLAQLIKRRKATYKVDYYLRECILELRRPREYISFDADFTVGGRDIRSDSREDDIFGQRLFDYATDLLINRHIPLFAQELYFHNTHKGVDTPFKLAHSAIRYLSQFPNSFQKIVGSFAGLSQIPNTQEDATRLFCSLRYPDYALPFHKSLTFDATSSIDLSDIEDAEDKISNLPVNYKEDLRKICEKNPTETILYYWNALTLAAEGKSEQAVEEAWKTLTLGREKCNWMICYKIGRWAEKAKDIEKAWIAYNMGYGAWPTFLSLKDGLDRVSQNMGVVSAYKPTPQAFIRKEDLNELPDAKMIDCQFIPNLDGYYTIRISCIFDTKETFTIQSRLSYTEPLQVIRIIDPFTKKSFKITPNSIFSLWANGYDFIKESQNFLKNRLTINIKPRVAFTVLNSSILGGGPSIIFRYANWLADLGVDVAIYSNDSPPQWISLNKVRFHNIPDDPQRYSAINESVVIVYSILEMPFVLRYVNTKGKRIFHICQGIEDFNYHGPDYASLIAPKPIFELLHSLPVGRVAVSYHVKNYFAEKYSQQTFTIINGIDLTVFKPRWKRRITNRINIMIVGNPLRLLKGADDVKQALTILANKHPKWKLHLCIVSNQRIGYGVDTSSFETSLHWELSPQEMHDMYRSADIFVNPAWYEGFGLPTLEAMACGVPVVQADNQGLDRIVENRRNCLIIPPENPRAIADAIEILVEDNALVEQLITNGIETASKFSLKNQYEAFVEAFENILVTKFDSTVVAAKKQELEYGTLDYQIAEEMKSLPPLISVIVPTYNHARYLPAALDSLIAQTYPNWEALVVNDGSTDDTPKVIEQYAAKDKRIRSFHKENGGVGSALNEGLRNAGGEWICWLSSDDQFLPNKLETHVYAFKAHPSFKVFHTDYFWLNEKTQEILSSGIDPDRLFPPMELQTLKFFQINYFNGISICIHRSVFESVGYFKENLRNGQDFDMWLRISALFKSKFLPQKTCIIRFHPASGTQLSVEAGIFDSARACLEFLNKHRFEELFPTLNMDNLEDYSCAIGNAINIVTQQGSFINRCGYAQALIDRIREWLAHSCPEEYKKSYEKEFETISHHIQNTSLSEDIKIAIDSLRGATTSNFVYKPYDPLELMKFHAERLETRGNYHEAQLIYKYLKRISKFENLSSLIDDTLKIQEEHELSAVTIATENEK